MEAVCGGPALHRGLLDCHGLPATVAANEDAHVSDLAGEGKSSERTNVVRDASEHGDVVIDLHAQAIVLHGEQSELAAPDVADVVRFVRSWPSRDISKNS